MKSAVICGVRISAGKKDELYRSVCELVGVGGSVFTPNLQILEKAEKDEGFKRFLNEASINIPDGIGVKYLLKRRGVVTDVLPGVELGERIVEGHSFAIIGGEGGRAELAGKILCRKNKSSRFLFSFCGYGYDEELIKSALASQRPDICIVCLGAPRQEYLIGRIKEASPKTLYLALGGSVDVYSGCVTRAPRVFRKMGLEWLYRCIREPSRIRRLAPQLAFFVREFFTVLNKKG